MGKVPVKPVLPGTGKCPDTTGFCRIKTDTRVNKSDFGIMGKLKHTHSACCNILSHSLNTVSFKKLYF